MRYTREHIVKLSNDGTWLVVPYSAIEDDGSWDSAMVMAEFYRKDDADRHCKVVNNFEPMKGALKMAHDFIFGLPDCEVKSAGEACDIIDDVLSKLKEK